MVGLQNIEGIEINYLGLACTRDEYKNSGIFIFLLLNIIEDALKNDPPKTCWLTTPSVQIFRIINKLLDNVNPQVNFDFSESTYELAKKINIQKGFKSDYDNPFVIRGAANLTRYSTKELERIGRHRIDISKRFFEKLSIKEHDGDRLLMICEFPSMEKLNVLQKLKRQFTLNAQLTPVIAPCK